MSNCARNCLDGKACSKLQGAIFFWRTEFACWRKISIEDNSHLLLWHLRANLTHEELAIMFGISESSASNYIQEALDAINSTKEEDLSLEDLEGVVIVDGSLIETDRTQGSSYNGKHKEHGMSVQAMVGLDGRLLALSQPLPGSMHDSKCVRELGWSDALKQADLMTIGDSGYQGLEWWVPIKKPKGGERTLESIEHNRVLASFRCVVERVFAKLKKWRILRRYRSRIFSLGAYVNAIRLLTWMD